MSLPHFQSILTVFSRVQELEATLYPLLSVCVCVCVCVCMCVYLCVSVCVLICVVSQYLSILCMTRADARRKDT